MIIPGTVQKFCTRLETVSSLRRRCTTVLALRQTTISSFTTTKVRNPAAGRAATSGFPVALKATSDLRAPSTFRSKRWRCIKPRSRSSHEDGSMAATGGLDPNVKQQQPRPSRAELVARVASIISASGTAGGGWDKCWKEGTTPWDVGNVTPVIQDLVDKEKLPDGRALVPGCGTGYDVLAMASKSRHVVGLDISETVNQIAKQIAAGSPNGAWAEFLVADFFEYSPDSPFDLIFDYTFFCAIDPIMRPAWAGKIVELLSPEGFLITLIFPIDEHEGGPPYAVSVEAYEDVLKPLGLTMTSCKDNELAVEGRKGREKIAHWTRSTCGSKI